MEGSKVMSFFKKQKDLLISTLAFVASALTFVFFMLELFYVQGESLSAVDTILNILMNLEDNLFGILGVFFLGFFAGELETLFTAAVLLPIFGIVTFVFTIVFIVRIIMVLVTYIKAWTGKLFWSMASEKLRKQYAKYFSSTVWYIVLAYSMLGIASFGIGLSGAGVGFIVVSSIYFVLKNLLNNALGDINHGIIYIILNVVYDGMKIAISIIVLNYFVKVALLQKLIEFTVYTVLAVISIFAAGAATEAEEVVEEGFKFYAQASLLPALKYMFANTAVKIFMDSMTLNMCDLDLEARAKTRNAMIVMIIGLVLDIIASFYLILIPVVGFDAWKASGGKYMFDLVIVLIIAFLVYLFKKVLAYALWSRYENQRIAAEIARSKRADELKQQAQAKKLAESQINTQETEDESATTR